MGLATGGTAQAHDPSRPDLNRWFDDLKSGRGACCAHIDGTTVADPDWESRNGHYRVRVPRWPHPNADMVWVDVPDDAVVKEPNRVGRTMVWVLRFDATITVRCFMPGTMI